MTPARPVRRLPVHVREALLALVATVAGLLLLEAAARVAWTVVQGPPGNRGSRALDGDWAVLSPDVGWEPRPGYTGAVAGVPRRFDSRGYLALDSAQVGDTANTTILFLGDSNTFGWRVPADSTFVEALERSVPGVAAINLGVPGWTSYQGSRALALRGDELAPDLLVVSFGFNDRRYVLGPEHVDGPRSFGALSRGRPGRPTVLAASYLYRGLDHLARRIRSRDLEPVALDTLRTRVGPAEYESNLAAIASWAQVRGVPLVFLTLRDNPVDAEWLQMGVALLERGRPQEAIAPLSAAVAKRNWFSDLSRIYLARAYRALGRDPEAAETVTVRPFVSLHGGTPIRLEGGYRAILERVATAYGAEVVDAGAVLAEMPSDYLDFTHPDVNGHLRIAELLRARLRPRLATSGLLSEGRSPATP